jgi:hypothetical protein
MFCNKCGAVVEHDSRFCDSCGKGLDPAAAPLGSRWRKHLTIALSALAAVAAIIIYEKVASSLPPDSHTAQKPTTVATLNPVQAAIADGTKDTQLTRPVALAVLQKEMSNWRGTISCSLTWAPPPLGNPGEMRHQQALIATGYLTQPTFPMEMWGNGTYHPSNSGVMTSTIKSKNWQEGSGEGSGVNIQDQCGRRIR